MVVVEAAFRRSIATSSGVGRRANRWASHWFPGAKFPAPRVMQA
jgi:hypothetical protein